MSYTAQEQSIEDGQPIELFEIILGGDTFRYTSAEDEVTVGGVVYTPEAGIVRGRFRQGPEPRNSTMPIDVSGSNEFARQFISSVPSDQARIIVRRLHRTDLTQEAVQLFEGRVGSVKFSNGGTRATLNVEPKVSATSRSIPRFVFSSLCNHVLYGSQCRVDDTSAAFRATLQITSVSSDGITITVPGIAAFGDGWFTAGSIEIINSSNARSVDSHVGDTITINVPFPSGILGQTAVLLAGCDQSIDTCSLKFNNVKRFGGFAFVPLLDIFEVGLDSAACNT